VVNTVFGRSATMNRVSPKWHHSFMVIVPGIEVASASAGAEPNGSAAMSGSYQRRQGRLSPLVHELQNLLLDFGPRTWPDMTPASVRRNYLADITIRRCIWSADTWDEAAPRSRKNVPQCDRCHNLPTQSKAVFLRDDRSNGWGARHQRFQPFRQVGTRPQRRQKLPMQFGGL
jgi:hypothetical protein